MLMVYKITNQINNKSYIGSTIRGYKRWDEHKKDAFNPQSNHYNYPLYRAFRKYGIENFKFEILKQDFIDIEEMQLFEQQMIYQFDSLNNGYNQTDFTFCALQDPQIKQKHLQEISQPCALVNNQQEIIKTFLSYQDTNKQMNFNNCANHIRKVCLGQASSYKGYIFRKLDNNGKVIKLPIKNFKNKQPIVGIDPSIKSQHVYYDSILEASKELNINRTSIQQCLKGSIRYWIVGGYIFRKLDQDGNIIENSYLLKDAINEYNRLNPIINNEQHNITDWCNIYNISRNCYYNRIKKGMTPIEAITTKKRK